MTVSAPLASAIARCAFDAAENTLVGALPREQHDEGTRCNALGATWSGGESHPPKKERSKLPLVVRMLRAFASLAGTPAVR